MTLKFNTSGRPMIECINPECKKLHSIYRRGDYVNRAQTRVSCRSCGTKWSLNTEDQAALQKHYEQRQQEIAAKKEKKIIENSKQNQTVSNQTITEKPTKKVEQTKPVKKQRKSWLEDILS